MMTVVSFDRTAAAPASAAMLARDRARAEIEDNLQRRVKDKKWKASMRLKDALEKLCPRGQDPAAQRDCLEFVEARLAGLGKTSERQADSAGQRDLQIILVYGVGKLPRDTLIKAFSLLQLRGSMPKKLLIAEAFPGFADAFSAK